MYRLFAAALAAVLLAGCGHQVQMTSGASYLSRYADAGGVGADPGTGRAGTSAARPGRQRVTPTVPGGTDPEIVAAASVEPQLRLPGRFGLARIVNGRLTAVPEAEATLWRELAARHRSLGEFVAISPLVAALAAEPVEQRCSHCGYAQDSREIVRGIRLGAARQHVDVVLIYEVGASASKGSTWLALADLTIIGGAFLPTRSIDAEGRAEVLLVDVRNGYPYGTASARVDLSEFNPSWGSDLRTDTLRQRAALDVVGKLMPEVEAMIQKLVMASLHRPAS